MGTIRAALGVQRVRGVNSLLGLDTLATMDARNERSLDNMVESLTGQLNMNGPQMTAVMATGDAKALVPVLQAVGPIIQELYTQIGRLDARLHAIDGEE